MSDEKLTDEELENVDSMARGHGAIGATAHMTRLLIAELRALRRAALSEADRLALSYALDIVRERGCNCGACRATTAARVLTRLVEQKP